MAQSAEDGALLLSATLGFWTSTRPACNVPMKIFHAT
jgi:hypothetical protein